MWAEWMEAACSQQVSLCASVAEPDRLLLEEEVVSRTGEQGVHVFGDKGTVRFDRARYWESLLARLSGVGGERPWEV